jgi:hypothetical protein
MMMVKADEQAALKPQLGFVPASAELHRPATPKLVLPGSKLV